MSGQRETWLDELRGFGIIWVVIGHTIERTISGLNYTNGVMRFFDVFANSMHIYILFMVSGYVYGLIERAKVLDGRENAFFKKKAIDFLLPYTYFGVLIWIGKTLFAQYVSKPVSFYDLCSMFITPMAFAWYLYVLFIITLLVVVVDKLTKGNNAVLWSLSIVFIIIQEIFDPMNITVHKVLHNLLFFVAGVILAQNKSYIEGRTKLILSGLVFAIFTVVHFYYDNVWVVLDAATHFSGALFFFMFFYHLRKRTNIMLTRIGEYTLYIYLLHPIVINSFKAIFLNMGLRNVGFWLISLFALGVAIPYLYAFLANRYKILEVLFRPRRYLMKKNKCLQPK